MGSWERIHRMKKIPYKLSILITMLITVFFAGCKKMPPTSIETGEETKKLESIAIKKGTIVDITFIAGNDYTQIKFSNGEVIFCGYHWKNRKDMKIGQAGTLFVSNNHDKKRCLCKTCWWSWKENSSSKEITKIIPTESKKQKANTIEGEWQRADQIKNLEANNFVLIKMDDNKIAIGFITYDKQWKLGLNKDKYRHGATITNVSKWKRINLE